MTTALSLMVLTAIALTFGAAFLWRRDGLRRQVVLMLVLAAVIAINVALWTMPTSSGRAPIDAVDSQPG